MRTTDGDSAAGSGGSAAVGSAAVGGGADLESEHSHASSAALVRQARLGDRHAFAELFELHGASVFRYALHMLDGDVDTARDVTQDAWVKVWRNLPGFRGESKFTTWVFTIVAREVVDHRRRRRRPVAIDDRLLAVHVDRDDAQPSAEAEMLNLQLWEALTLALAELPWRQRSSWLLREMEGLSYAEIATVLDTTPTVVRGQLHRARASLAIRMEQWR